MQTAIPTVLMRGGTSKGLYFHKKDLPENIELRDKVLLAAMGSPDDRQIDGVGGAHPLTSKVAIINESNIEGIDVDYLFLQVKVDEASVSDGQNCGNILAGVGPFAIESGIVKAQNGVTDVHIHMVNSGAIAIACIQTPNKQVAYHGDAIIDGVPGSSASVQLDFRDVAGSTCGALLPTGNVVDIVNDFEVTCIDNGMPIVLLHASDFGKTGKETPLDLEADVKFKEKIEKLRLELGPLMNLGDVSEKTVPKMTLVSAAKKGGTISTRSLIPHRVHDAIGVLGAASVAAACQLPGSVANRLAKVSENSENGRSNNLIIEHPTGSFSVAIDMSIQGDKITVHRSALLRTARKLMQGSIFVPSTLFEK